MATFNRISVGIDPLGTDATETDPPTGIAAPRAGSAAAFDTAVWLAVTDGAPLHLAASLDLDTFSNDWLAHEEAAGRATARTRAYDHLVALAKDARDRGVVSTSVATPIGAPADTILADVAAAKRDLVVIGTRERGRAARNLLGSTSLRIVRRAPCAAWVARRPFPSTAAASGNAARVVACAIELGDMAPRVLAQAVRLANAAGAALHVIHVVDLRASDVLRAGSADGDEIRRIRAARRERAEREVPALVAAAVASIGAARVGAPAPTLHLVDGDTNETIVETTHTVGAELLVIGSVVHGPLAALLGIGRTAEHVLTHAQASLLVLKP